MATEPGGNGGTRWRLDDHERRLSRVEDANVQVLAERVSSLTSRVERMDIGQGRRMDALEEDQKSLRRALYMAALSVAGSALIFAITVFALIGKFG